MSSSPDAYPGVTPELQLAAYRAFRLIDLRTASISAACAATVLSTAVAYLLFSSSYAQRRTPLFWIHVTMMASALLQHVCVLTVAVRNGRLTPVWDGPYNTLRALEAFFGLLVPILADITLLIKLSAFWPPRLYSTQRRLALFAFPLALKPVRVIVWLWFFIYNLKYSLAGSTFFTVFAFVGYLLYSLDNLYCSSLLLYKSIYFHRLRMRVQQRNTSLIKRRLRFLVESVLMTFIPSTILSITATILAGLQPGFGAPYGPVLPTSDPRAVLESQIATSSNRVLAAVDSVQEILITSSVVFSILATTWSSVRERGYQKGRAAAAAAAGSGAAGSSGRSSHPRHAHAIRELLPAWLRGGDSGGGVGQASQEKARPSDGVTAGGDAGRRFSAASVGRTEPSSKASAGHGGAGRVGRALARTCVLQRALLTGRSRRRFRKTPTTTSTHDPGLVSPGEAAPPPPPTRQPSKSPSASGESVASSRKRGAAPWLQGEGGSSGGRDGQAGGTTNASPLRTTSGAAALAPSRSRGGGGGAMRGSGSGSRAAEVDAELQQQRRPSALREALALAGGAADGIDGSGEIELAGIDAWGDKDVDGDANADDVDEEDDDDDDDDVAMGGRRARGEDGYDGVVGKTTTTTTTTTMGAGTGSEVVEELVTMPTAIAGGQEDSWAEVPAGEQGGLRSPLPPGRARRL